MSDAQDRDCHPNYELVYYAESGEVIYDFRKKKEDAK
jgi:hypothetical protein